MTPVVPNLTLNNGVEMPAIGFGVFSVLTALAPTLLLAVVALIPTGATAILATLMERYPLVRIADKAAA